MKSIRLATVAVSAVLFTACSPSAPVELARVASPTGEFDALFVEYPTNATVGFIYGVAIVRKGGALKDPAPLTGSSLEKGTLRWEDPKTVVIEYDRAGWIYSFVSRWYPPDVVAGAPPRSIEIVLLPKLARDAAQQIIPPDALQQASLASGRR